MIYLPFLCHFDVSVDNKHTINKHWNFCARVLTSMLLPVPDGPYKSAFWGLRNPVNKSDCINGNMDAYCNNCLAQSNPAILHHFVYCNSLEGVYISDFTNQTRRLSTFYPFYYFSSYRE